MIRAFTVIGLVTAAAFLSSTCYGASTAEKRAAESFSQAQAAFARREYAAAAAAFEKAAEFDPHPAPLLNAAQAWELARDFVRAAEDCDRVLGMPNVGDAFTRAARDALARVEPKIATLDLVGPRTLAVHVDDGPEIRVPTRKRVPPGHHELAVVDLASPTTYRTTVTLAIGESRTLELTPPAPEAAPNGVARPAPTKPRVVDDARAPGTGALRAGLWISLGATVAAAGATTVFGIMTLNAREEYNADPNTTTQSAFYRDRLVTNVALAVTAVGAGASFVLWQLSRRATASSATVTALPTSDGGHVVTTVKF